MRPTGVTLIAIYHFLGAAIAAVFAVILMAGGKIISMLGGPELGMLPKTGYLIGMVGGGVLLAAAALFAIAGYGLWKMHNWGRIMSIVLAVLSILIAIPGLLLTAFAPHLLFGGFRLARVGISIAVLWYLMLAETKAVFHAAA